MIKKALTRTTDTVACVVDGKVAGMVPSMFRELFPGKKAVVVGDVNTMRVAGAEIAASLDASGLAGAAPFVFDDPELYAHWKYVEMLRSHLQNRDVIAVAVGSGVINDLVKYVSEELGRRYIVFGTAASMDGYTAYGASITKDGIKQTLGCRAPLGCIVDTEIAAAAPKELTASGYADLIAKIPAGADWMLAAAIGSEAIDDFAWELVQQPLRDSLYAPEACAQGSVGNVAKLCEGLIMSGFAMQAMGSSRPASGTEHQFSHYWDMEDLCFEGKHVSHGFKVGIGTLASTATIEFLLEHDLSKLDVDACVAKWWKTFDEMAATFPSVYGNRPAHIERALSEMKGKYSTPEALGNELRLAAAAWPELSGKLRAQIMPFNEVHAALETVGAPCEPEQIGLTRARLRETFAGIPFMRSRYFSLDMIQRLGLMPELLNRLFGVGGIWQI